MVILTHATALALWRRHYIWEPLDVRSCRNALDEGTSRTEMEDVADALGPAFSLDIDSPWPDETHPMDVLVASHRSRFTDLAYCRWHRWSKDIPSQSLYRIVSTQHGLRGRPFVVTSPELTLLTLAVDHSIPELIRVGFELCGTYRLDPLSPNGFHSDRDPLCTPESILACCRNAFSGVRGVSVLKRTARNLLPNAASPREAATAGLLCAKRPYGGRGLPMPELNAPLNLNTDAKVLSGRDHLCIDLLWRKQRVGIEYDSTQFHAHVDPAKVDSDKKRSNAALLMGVTLIPVTNDQLTDPYRFDSLSRLIAKKIGYRHVPLKGDQLVAEGQLRKSLLDTFEPVTHRTPW